MEELVDQYVPEEQRKDFEFHAHNLYGQFHRSDYRALLTGLLSLPVKHGVPIFYAAVSRAWLHKDPSRNSEITEAGLAFLTCALRVNAWIHSLNPNEQVLWIADNSRVAKEMRTAHTVFHDKPIVGQFEFMRLRHIIDTIYFGDSKNSRALQLADACNFAIKRHLMKKPDAERLFQLIAPIVFSGPTWGSMEAD